MPANGGGATVIRGRYESYLAAVSKSENQQLWEDAPLPEWGEESPRRLFELFLSYTARRPGATTRGLSPPQLNEYSSLLMALVRMRFRQKRYLTSLRRLEIDPDDVGQKLMLNLLDRSAALVLEHPCEKVLLRWLGMRIHHFVLTQIKRAMSRRREVSAAELATDESVVGDPIDRRSGGVATVDIAELRAGLREHENDVCGDVPGDPRLIRKLYRLLCWWTVLGVPQPSGTRRQGLPTHTELPQRLRERIKREQFNAITPRVRRLVRELADVPAS